MAIKHRSNGEMALIDSPDCGKCGCKDARYIKGRKYCRYCGKPWIKRLVRADNEDKKPEKIVYHIMRCPACGSDKTRVTRTVRPLRYHKCQDCKHNFQSEEE